MKSLKNYVTKESIVIFILVVVVALLCFKINKANKVPEDIVLEDMITLETLSDEKGGKETIPDEKMYVDVKGAVNKVGMYEVSSDMRVSNVIDMAGGLTDIADEKQINFSQRLEDQMVIYIPYEGEEISENQFKSITNNSGSTNQRETTDLININQATKEELMLLNGVGEKKAEKIIEYREENGSFKAIEDLKNVNGFGEKSFESLKNCISI